jgi:hypothetical protein
MKRNLLLVGLIVLLLIGGAVVGSAFTTVTLKVINDTDYTVTIYVDDVYFDTISAGDRDSFEIPYGYNVLEARAPGTDLKWGPKSIDDEDFYTWTLSD